MYADVDGIVVVGAILGQVQLERAFSGDWGNRRSIVAFLDSETC